jgi:hypothetical protein
LVLLFLYLFLFRGARRLFLQTTGFGASGWGIGAFPGAAALCSGIPRKPPVFS